MTQRNVEEDGPRYWIVHTNEDNIAGAGRSAAAGDLIPICDEDEGGIIAYATCEAHAERIIRALEVVA